MPKGGIVFDSYCFTQQTVTAGTISANASTEVSVPFTGIQTTDFCVQATKPTLTSGIDVGNFRISAAGILKITFQNSTSAGIAVPSENWTFLFARPEHALGGPDALSSGQIVFN